MTTTPKQQNTRKAAPSVRGSKQVKPSGFGARVVKARERQKLTRSTLTFQMHVARCDVQHPLPPSGRSPSHEFKLANWPLACSKDTDRLWSHVAAIEAGKRGDPELEAELAQRLGIAAPKAAVEAA